MRPRCPISSHDEHIHDAWPDHTAQLDKTDISLIFSWLNFPFFFLKKSYHFMHYESQLHQKNRIKICVCVKGGGGSSNQIEVPDP